MTDELREQFPGALDSADSKYLLKKQDKQDSWKEMSLADLYRLMKRHNIALGSFIAEGSIKDVTAKATDVLLYALMISERARTLGPDE